MEHKLRSSLTDAQVNCLVIGLFSEQSISDIPLPETTQGLLTQLQAKLAQAGDTVYQAEHNGQSILLVHCGLRKDYTPKALTADIAQITKILIQQRLCSALIHLPLLQDKTPDWQLEQMILQVEAESYQFLTLKTKKNEPHALADLAWYLPGATDGCLNDAKIIAKSIKNTRDLGNLPANICTPHYLAKQAHILDSHWDSVTAKVLDKRGMENLGMGALLAVSQGSVQEPQLIVIKYNGQASTEAPIVLVGKGITFDSGGISLKPPDSMEEMKFDMAGAASVLGIIEACATLHLPLNIIGLMPCAENMPSGSATRPGDVVTSMSGQTIEIVNTDAEGRLILADALTYAKQFNPKFVIDIATLTGAVLVALGQVTSGLMSNDDELANLLLDAGIQSQDKAWRLPLDPLYQEMIDSPIADIANSTNSRLAGSITAGCFLSRFTESFRWAHLDIAGTAWVSGKERCATGRPVALLLQFLRQLAYHAR